MMTPSAHEPSAQNDSMNAAPVHTGGQPKKPGLADLAEAYVSKSGLSRNAQGHIDLKAAVGGWRGLAEAVLPGLIFLISFIAGQNLALSLILAIAAGAIFTMLRLVQRGSLMQSFSGLAGIVICALFSGSTGKALDYYVPGFVVNLVSIAVVLLSIAVRWPVTGLLFGFLRGENVDWRQCPDRRRAYTLAAWIVLSLFVLRLAVQYPLFLTGNLLALGATRLAMGVPLYALALWLAWMISRPAVIRGLPSDQAGSGPSSVPPA